MKSIKWTIRTRLITGCVLLLAVIAAACSYGVQLMTKAQQSTSAIAENNGANIKLMRAAQKGLFATEVGRRDFLLNKQQSSVEGVHKGLKLVREELGQYIEKHADQQAVAQSAKDALSCVDRYEKAFGRLVELMTQRGLTPADGLEGQMRKAAHTVETLTNEQGLAELSVLLLTCRRNEKDYLMRLDPKYVAANAKVIEEFAGQMKQFSLSTDVQAKVNAAFKTYFTSLQAMAAVDASIQQTVAETVVVATDYNKAIESMNEAAMATIHEAESNSIKSAEKGRLAMLVLLGLGSGLGLVVGVVLVRSICPALEATVRSLQAVSLQTKVVADSISHSSQSLAEGASEQAASVEETSASLEEMSSMTKRNAEAAKNAQKVAGQARGIAEKGSVGMQHMTTAMEGIKTSSSEIAKIIKTIDEIAFQTNILALNAAVEAARAGEAGAGFAVVADEVRSLAQRSAAAAKETAGKIETAMAKSEEGARANAEVSTLLSEIVDQVRSMDTLVGEIATASNEQSQGIEQLNSAVSQIDKVTQSNAAVAEESATSANELIVQYGHLVVQVDTLSIMVGVKPQSATDTPQGDTVKGA
ncbi:MAG: hypothetical protein H2172_07675 [Opitutus sp.]|nr:hypothetical protein [Opitutus sp.]MCS6245912.1 hypothetical protein [Opitutus sp.]MCS6272950.1 hypothetical protein [Opitutus sp.]MCS6276009.1 hypothetical protein [Opitutus sp.]MCS6301104.1 hypothetical protein [Opitutus sp.]